MYGTPLWYEASEDWQQWTANDWQRRRLAAMDWQQVKEEQGTTGIKV